MCFQSHRKSPKAFASAPLRPILPTRYHSLPLFRQPQTIWRHRAEQTPLLLPLHHHHRPTSLPMPAAPPQPHSQPSTVPYALSAPLLAFPFCFVPAGPFRDRENGFDFGFGFATASGPCRHDHHYHDPLLKNLSEKRIAGGTVQSTVALASATNEFVPCDGVADFDSTHNLSHNNPSCAAERHLSIEHLDDFYFILRANEQWWT